MSTAVVSGKIKWFRLTPNKWGKYSFCFYPSSSEERKKIADMRIKNLLNEDEDGLFYRFSSAEKFKVVDRNDAPVSKFGNGTEVDLHIILEEFKSKFGPVRRAVVDKIVVTKVVPFVRSQF